MSKMVWIRLWFKSKDEVIIKLKRWGWPVNWQVSYYDYASTRSERNRCEAELVSAIQKVRKCAVALVEADVAHKGDLAVASEGHEGGRFGVSLPRKVLAKVLKDYDTFYAKPDEKIWREALNPKWIAQLGLNKTVKKASSGDSTPPRASRRSYTTADQKTLDEHRVEFGGDDTDSVEVFEEKKGDSSNKGAMKEWKKSWRKENPFDGETHDNNKAYEVIVQEEWENHCH